MTRIAKPLIKSAMAAGLVTASMSLSTAVAHAGPSPNWDAVAQCELGQLGGQHRKRQIRRTAVQAGHLGRIRRCRQPSSCLSGTTNRSCQSGSRRTGLDAWPTCGAASGLPIALWSKPAQGIKQIINEIIWAGIQASIPR